ncbi:FAD-dependent oxidoreductase [Salsuginibacillus kocurii]|uniref:oxidoreductase n=1 Tax=Salsuginibacillus kocurii TaxID=427078 RepID=UPI000371519C|nr:NADPH-dependent 2,4-dienoyl-CoA reductase [Salsuginibacillus kocurii]
MVYSHLFTPLRLREMELKNRVMMGSMHVGLEGEENGLAKLTAFYTARARHEVGLIVTGGAAVLPEGSGGADFMSIASSEDVDYWKPLTEAVHNAGGKIALQLFHAGRYAYKNLTGLDPVAPSPLQSPINPDLPLELDEKGIERTIQAFADGARRAKQAGFDAVEIMGSEGYLINQFVSPVTNQRSDKWGGSLENRLRFPLAISRRVRSAVGEAYPVIFRMSGLDLIEGSTTEEETIQWAKRLQSEGIDMLNVGIGWHESKVPTISMKVPRNNFIHVAETLKQHVSIPVIASNRINNPEDAEAIIKDQQADMISMARPFLADPELLIKAKERRLEEINTCIACNQACLDHVFEGKSASCLVNPEAGRELTLTLETPEKPKRLLVIGAGPAGLEAARVAALRGHDVTIADTKTEIGGQLNYSKIVPGKSEFHETIRYFHTQLKKLGVKMALGEKIHPEHELVINSEEVIVANGIVPRKPEIPGVELPHVYSYRDVFEGRCKPGNQIVIIGGGGIACDLALFLKGQKDYDITLLQRSEKFARGIGKTTRWATLMEVKKQNVQMVGGISYQEITNEGVACLSDGKETILPADTVILASGQLPNPELYERIKTTGKPAHVIGGASDALGLDAKKAILAGTTLGRAL